ncbi:SurA N-terminal domain-containing protein [Aliiglaciecola sp. LCG003]|uniref:SurA N-terminal domain-containing protein n=1 Tax=Aliiglaciecola sp. LCG003 TaxID=3053655 RepID=UPI00257299E9|nr:SurA N-terminal domain-containing protein [Aliiglaciecola sp. LCG003]WJG08497.1 SurA N-terminal domain-containing protein [Aliiglaciecola sp. LCG003]
MLERIREGSQGTWAVVILGLVILSFVFAGVGGYVSSTGTAAAEVNGDEISLNTFERAYENERARLESQYGEAFTALTADAAYLNQFRQSVLDRLIADKLIEQAAEDLGLRVSNQQISQQIVNMPEFQVGGQFDNVRFQNALRQVGYQTSTFRDYMRTEMTRQQVAKALLGSEFTLQSEASRVLKLQAQTRNLQFITIPSESFKQSIEVSEDDINIFYQQNLLRFDTEEKVSLQYVELNADDFLVDIDVTEQELQDLYERSSSTYRTEEERRVSHILFETADNADAAQEKADEAVKRLNNGEDFATVAKDMSEDTFSAENGGDLDFFAQGMMDPAFADASFELKNVGDVSAIVESEFGLHIIKLTDIKAQQVTPFEDVKEELVKRVKSEKAIEEFYLAQNQLKELAFEMPDSLVDVAEAIGVTVQETALFTAQTAPEKIANPTVLAAAFSTELTQDKVNSEVISIGDNHVVVLRVKEYEPERTKALQEVKEQIVTQLVSEKAQAAAKAWANELLVDLQAGNDISAKLADKDLAWELQAGVARFGAALPRGIVDQAFKMSATEGANQAVVELASGNVGLVQLNSINLTDEVPAEQITAMQQRLGQARAEGSYASLIAAMRAEADISINQL